jgi:hypothetical protein
VEPGSRQHRSMTSSPSAAFLLLRTFNAEQMRMSHIYQLQTLPESSRRLRHKPEKIWQSQTFNHAFSLLTETKRALSSNRQAGMETPELQSTGE